MTTAVPSGVTPGPGQEEPAGEATVLRMLLGAQLRRLREAAGMSAEDAGYEIRASRSKISRMETGRVGLKLCDIEDLLTLYGVAGSRPTSAWSPPPSQSAASRHSSCRGCSRPRTTRAR